MEWEKALLHDAKHRAKKKEILFEITVKQVIELYESQDGKCYWLGFDLEPSCHAYSLTQPSLDRLDTSKGYTFENCVLSCLAANHARSSASTFEWLEFIKKLRNDLEFKDLRYRAE